MKQLVLGGVRSGKSLHAEKIAATQGKPVIYIATAQNTDPDMQRRIAIHQLRRPSDWQLVEEPITLSTRLNELASENHCILVDCLTLWLNNVTFSGHDSKQKKQADTATRITELCIELVNCVEQLSGDIILVSSEIGLGVIPENTLARDYCDHLGELNQALASVCDRVIFCVAGIPQVLKDA